MQAKKKKQNLRELQHNFKKLSNLWGVSNSLLINFQSNRWVFNNIYSVKNKIMDNIHKARLPCCQFIDRTRIYLHFKAA